MKNSFIQLMLAGIVSGAVISTVLGVLFHAQVTRVEQEIQTQFQKSMEIFRSQRDWKEKSLSELLGPVYMQLDRTERAFIRWKAKNLYLEAKVIREGNSTLLNLLLAKGHLIPPELLDHAGKLVQHYDAWLEKFENQRLSENPDLESAFVFVGPDGYPFPRPSADAFQETFQKYWQELYGGSRH